MSFFNLNSVQDNKVRAYAADNAGIPGIDEPSFFTGAFSAPFEGVYNGLVAKPAVTLSAAINEALLSGAEWLDNEIGTDAAGFLKRQHQLDIDMVKRLTPDPATTGTAGQVLNGLFDMGGQALVGSKIAGPLGSFGTVAGLQGYADYEDSKAKGVDKATAINKAAVTGLTAGAGVTIPMSFGLRAPIASATTLSQKALNASVIASDIGMTTGANVAAGMAQRGFTSDILRNAGYHEMANQYKVFDEQAIMVDALLGLAFGGVGKYVEAKISPDHIDAALTANEAIHAENAAPGIPTNPQTRSAHISAMNKALSDLKEGKPVDVANFLIDAEFIPKPLDSYISEVNSTIKDLYPDMPMFYTREGFPIPESSIKTQIESLQPLADQLLPVGERKALQSEIYTLQNQLVRLENSYSELINKPVKASGRELSQIRDKRASNIQRLNGEITSLKEQLAVKQQTINENSKGGKFFEAKANISRLEQGIIPDNLLESVYQSTGELVPQVNRFENAYIFDESQSISDINNIDVDSQIVDQAINSNPELVVSIPDDDGNIQKVKAADLLAQADNGIAAAKHDAKLFDAAIACFLRG